MAARTAPPPETHAAAAPRRDDAIRAALAAPAAVTAQPTHRFVDPAAAVDAVQSTVVEADVPALVRQLARALLRAPQSAGEAANHSE